VCCGWGVGLNSTITAPLPLNFALFTEGQQCQMSGWNQSQRLLKMRERDEALVFGGDEREPTNVHPLTTDHTDRRLQLTTSRLRFRKSTSRGLQEGPLCTRYGGTPKVVDASDLNRLISSGYSHKNWNYSQPQVSSSSERMHLG
jgi:hypothetical protein